MIKTNTDLTRTELLIVIKYLLEHSDKNHLVSQQEVIAYGIKHFNHEIRRQRIKEILEYLYRIKDDGLIPFSVNRDSDRERYKYFADKRSLSIEEIVRIVDSIKLNKYLIDETVEELVSKVLSLHASEYEKQDILKTVEKDTFSTHKYSKKILKLYNDLHKAKENKDIVTLLVKEKKRVFYKKFYSANDSSDDILSKSSTIIRSEVRGYIYKIVEFDDNLYAMCGIISEKRILPISLQQTEIIKIEKSYDFNSTIHDVVPDFGYDSIEDYLKDTIIPVGTSFSNIVFKFDNDEDDIKLETVKNLFERHFKISMQYDKSFETRAVYPRTVFKDGTFREEIKKDIPIVTVKTRVPLFSFVNWNIHPELLGKIEVLEPSIVINLLHNKMEFIFGYYTKMLEEKNLS